MMKGQLEKSFLMLGQYSRPRVRFVCIAKAADGDGGVGGRLDVT